MKEKRISIAPPTDVKISLANLSLLDETSSYLERNERFLLKRLEDIKSYILEELSVQQIGKISVLVVGSDGRMENSPGSIAISPTEFCILAEDDKDTFPALTAICKGIKNGRLQAIETSVEIKTLIHNYDGYVLSGYRGNPKRAWPDRILDAHLLMGSKTYIEKARKMVFAEGDTYKELRKSLRNNHNYHANITKTGSKGDNVHINYQTGELFFDHEHYIRGLKYGPIRLIQTLLTYRQMALGGNDGYLSTSTTRKLLALYPEEDEVVKSYQQALFLYHQQQYARSQGKTGKITVDPSVLNHICQTLYAFDQREYPLLMEAWNKRVNN